MSTLDKNIKELIAVSKIGALLDLKAKIQEEIDELESQKEVDNEIPF